MENMTQEEFEREQQMSDLLFTIAVVIVIALIGVGMILCL